MSCLQDVRSFSSYRGGSDLSHFGGGIFQYLFNIYYKFYLKIKNTSPRDHFLTANSLVSFQNDLLTLRNCKKRPFLPLNCAKIAQKWLFSVLEMAILAKFQGKKGHFWKFQSVKRSFWSSSRVPHSAPIFK
jgi:hypothetical protein